MLARVMPPTITPVARVLAAGPAAAVATTAPTAQKVPLPSAAATRPTIASPKLELSALTTCPAAKTSSAATRAERRGRRRVARDITGAPIIMPTAKAVISVPALETLTPRAPEISGNRPETTNSLVPMMKVMAPSSHTTGGSLTFPAGAAVPPSPVRSAAAEGSGFVDEGELTDDPFKRK